MHRGGWRRNRAEDDGMGRAEGREEGPWRGHAQEAKWAGPV